MDDLLTKSTWCTMRFVQNGFEETAAFGLGGGESPFQSVAESHHLLDFGDNAILLFDRRERGNAL